MPAFAYEDAPARPREEVVAAQQSAWLAIAAAGSFWTGAQRVALASQAREARRRRADPPWLRNDLPDSGDLLPKEAVEAARTIAADAHKIDRTWAEAKIAALGDGPYVEIAALTASLCAIDTFADALGAPYEPLPTPVAGEPSGERNPSIADAGAYVPLQDPWQGPNVGRALSLVPASNAMFFGLVMTMYGGPERFFELVWKDGPLTRPQVELLAARVSSVNECFY